MSARVMVLAMVAGLSGCGGHKALPTQTHSSPPKLVTKAEVVRTFESEGIGALPMNLFAGNALISEVYALIDDGRALLPRGTVTLFRSPEKARDFGRSACEPARRCLRISNAVVELIRPVPSRVLRAVGRLRALSA
jgi:hypothetical protein